MPSQVKFKPIHKPSHEEAASIINGALKKNFADVSVSVVECPDLRKGPFGLEGEGLCGSPRLVEIGGVPYLVPLAKREKVYDLHNVAKQADMKENAFIVGAGAGPHQYMGLNCELIANLKTGPIAAQGSRITSVDLNNGGPLVEKLPNSETSFALMANLFMCEGKPGQVIQVKANKRTGEDDFIGCIRKGLTEHYGEKPVGMGGTFLLKKGKAKIHIMPDFSKVPLNSVDEVNKWLKFYDMSAPMVFCSAFISHDPGLDLRLEHSHGYNETEGGHYHNDVTPDEVEYEGYFNLSDFIYRVDAPHKTG